MTSRLLMTWALLSLSVSCTAFADLNAVAIDEPDVEAEADTSPEPDPIEDASPESDPVEDADPEPDPVEDTTPDVPAPDLELVACGILEGFHSVVTPEEVTYSRPQVAFFPGSGNDARILIAWEQSLGRPASRLTNFVPTDLGGTPVRFPDSVSAQLGASFSPAAIWDGVGFSMLTGMSFSISESLIWTRVRQSGQAINAITALDNLDDNNQDRDGLFAPTLIAGPDLGGFAAWMLSPGESTHEACADRRCLRVQRIESDGPADSAPVLATGVIDHPKLAFTGETLMAAWQDNNSPGNEKVAYVPLDPDTLIPTRPPIAGPANTLGRAPAQIATLGGNFIIAWLEPTGVDEGTLKAQMLVVAPDGQPLEAVEPPALQGLMDNMQLVDLGDRLGVFWSESESNVIYTTLDLDLEVLTEPRRLITGSAIGPNALSAVPFELPGRNPAFGTLLGVTGLLPPGIRPQVYTALVGLDGGLLCLAE